MLEEPAEPFSQTCLYLRDAVHLVPEEDHAPRRDEELGSWLHRQSRGCSLRRGLPGLVDWHGGIGIRVSIYR